MEPLPILYHDDFLVAVDKPRGMVVHAGRKPIEREFVVMKVLKDQIGKFVHTIHRLDRPTSGVLLFAVESEAGKAMHRKFAEHDVEKRYLAVVRGATPEQWECTDPLRKEGEETWRESHTRFKTLHTLSPGAFPAFPEAGFSLVEAAPVSGRHHQIRQHLAAADAPIVGDYLYGDPGQNDALAEKTGISRMMLMAERLSFDHPVTGARIDITAPRAPEFLRFAPPAPADESTP